MKFKRSRKKSSPQGTRLLPLIARFRFRPLPHRDPSLVRSRTELLRVNIQRHHIAAFALHRHFERPTAHFAIGGEPLITDSRVEFQLGALATIGTLNLFGKLHTGSNSKQYSEKFLPLQIAMQKKRRPLSDRHYFGTSSLLRFARQFQPLLEPL